MSPALCQWSEVMNHPGLVCCVQQTTGIPLVIMVKPDTFLIQEIKTLPAKAKVRTTYCTDVELSLAGWKMVNRTSETTMCKMEKGRSLLKEKQ